MGLCPSETPGINCPCPGFCPYGEPCLIDDEELDETEASKGCIEKRTIWVKPSCFAPEFEMVVPIPDDRDAEEYIDELLGGILNEDMKYNVEWDFVDGIS